MNGGTARKSDTDQRVGRTLWTASILSPFFQVLCPQPDLSSSSGRQIGTDFAGFSVGENREIDGHFHGSVSINLCEARTAKSLVAAATARPFTTLLTSS
jgi:hypothetical protein